MTTLPSHETHRFPDTGSSSSGGLRERKKRETRQTIVRAAMELFEQQGFHTTTIAQIAERAVVSPRTVSTYFPVKEELVFSQKDEWLAGLASHLASRPDGETTMGALATWVAQTFQEEQLEADHAQLRRRVIDADEDLRAYELGILAQVEGILTAEIARDLALPATGLEPRIAAAAMIAVVDLLGRSDVPDQTAGGQTDSAAREAASREMFAKAIAFVTGGIEALRGP